MTDPVTGNPADPTHPSPFDDGEFRPRNVGLFCDEGACENDIGADIWADSRDAAFVGLRLLATDQGWQITSTRDYCPEHRQTAPIPSSPVALLDQLDELRATATPGPWYQARHIHVFSESASRPGIGQMYTPADAALIVAAVNAVGPLADAVRDALSVVDRDARFCPDCRQGIDDTHSRVRYAITAALSVTP